MPATSDAPPLSSGVLAGLAERGIAVPRYDRTIAGPRIAHVGVGGFHRSHQALYLDELAADGGDWRIVGIGPLPQDRRMADALDGQDHLYTLVERGAGAPVARVIGSIVGFTLAGADMAGAEAVIARPDVRIVSLTVTEAGYGGSVDASPTVFDGIAAGLERRMAAGLDPVTVLSCDNIRHNGAVAREATVRAAARRSAALAAWIDRECAFPSSMVDRITPATTDADRDWVREHVGVTDRWPVVAEPFRQWVLEDRFASGRPALERVGVLFTDRVGDWETYKLRLLNATHSVLAYVAALAGIGWVDEALREPRIRHLVDRFLTDEALPPLVRIPGHPPEAYAASVLERFSASGVRDQVARLCVDGTVKIATFVMPTVLAQLAAGGPVSAAALAIAAWARYLAVVPAAEQAHDTHGDEARRYAQRAQEDSLAFLDFQRVFAPEAATSPAFREAFARQLRRLADADPLEVAAQP